MCRPKDGRLMCILRNCSGVPYGQCWREDEGKTWTMPVAMVRSHRVQPGLVAMGDGTAAMSGGRPGILAWLNLDGTGSDWQAADVAAHHSACCPEETLSGTTCYTQIVRLADEHLLLIYDRVPHGWNAIPGDCPEPNSVRVMRVAVQRDAREVGEK